MGKLHLTETGISELFIIECSVFCDYRGSFTEAYNKRDFDELGITKEFLQDNKVVSKRGVLRGLHFQHKHPQAKLVRVIQGEVFDVAVDLRHRSETFGKWFGIKLSEENNKMLYIPEGFAHGYLVLSEKAIFYYKCTDYYYPEDQFGLIWNDPDIRITWPFIDDQIILSEQDKNWGGLKELKLIV
ncbi:dTDP-4-dehydrorhamnose 3,5-epimerase [Brassicibacter mesophilus]|uniref:dTDP-4-dehydrorhamnose 3,5-epimerase n=1 Tax=Brassicibacter mesophilus TaxID=745119 RepID=UPI003D1A649C